MEEAPQVFYGVQRLLAPHKLNTEGRNVKLVTSTRPPPPRLTVCSCHALYVVSDHVSLFNFGGKARLRVN